MGKPAGSFTVALGEELKARLVAAAHAAGTSPAVLARRAIAEALRDQAEEQHAAAPVSRTGEGLREIRVRLPESATARLAAAAYAAGMTRSAYATAAIIGVAERSRAGRGPEPQPAGLQRAGTLREALVKSNATLAPIGRNLNQVARVLNMHPGLISKTDRENLAEVAQRVVQHLELVSGLLHAIRAPRFPATGRTSLGAPEACDG
jgi:predicted transcriptional regulator